MLCFFFCSDGVCVCNKCFSLNPETSMCFACRDYPFITSTNMCGSDVRQDQRRAFFLSLFLSSTGAANFYIKSYALGKYLLYVSC